MNIMIDVIKSIVNSIIGLFVMLLNLFIGGSGDITIYEKVVGCGNDIIGIAVGIVTFIWLYYSVINIKEKINERKEIKRRSKEGDQRI